MKIAQNKLRPELRGVGGWLRFLVISMMVLSPLMEIGQYSDLYGKLPEVLRLPLGCLSAIFVFTLIWLGNQLRTVFEWRTVRVVVNALWILPIAFNLSVALIIYAYAHNDVVFGALIPQTISGLIVSAVWITYLLRSQRVRNTYIGGPIIHVIDPRQTKFSNPYWMAIYVVFAIWYWAYWVFAVYWWNTSSDEQVVLVVGFLVSLYVGPKLFKAGRLYLQNGTKLNRIAALVFLLAVAVTTIVGHNSLGNSDLFTPTYVLGFISLISGLIAFTSVYPSLTKWIQGDVIT